MKLFGATIDRSARDKQWGFTRASLPRSIKGSDIGMLVCHGFGGSPANMRCLYEAAAQMGLTVEVPLLKGHAATFGELEKYCYTDWQDDVNEAYQRLIDAGCKKIMLCGLSMGALLMAELAERRIDDGPVDSLIMISPALKMRGYLEFSRVCLGGLCPYVVTRDGFNDNPDMELYFGMATRKLKEIHKLSNMVLEGADRLELPVLLVEAGNDERVHPKTYRILRRALKNCDYRLIEGASHGISYCPKVDELTEVFREFVTGRLNEIKTI